MKQGDDLSPVLLLIFVNAVATSLQDVWTFQIPMFRWRPDTKGKGMPKGSLVGANWNNKGQPFNFLNSHYMDVAAFSLLNRKDLEDASRLIVSHFRNFGLTVHAGSCANNCGSKTEVMHVRRPNQLPEPHKTADVVIDEDRFFEFFTEFKCLGNTMHENLNDSIDIHDRIKKFVQAFGAVRVNVFQNRDMPIKLRMSFHNVIIVNLALWGCESWALKESNVKALESFHDRCLRSVLGMSLMQRTKATEI